MIYLFKEFKFVSRERGATKSSVLPQQSNVYVCVLVKYKLFLTLPLFAIFAISTYAILRFSHR